MFFIMHCNITFYSFIPILPFARKSTECSLPRKIRIKPATAIMTALSVDKLRVGTRTSSPSNSFRRFFIESQTRSFALTPPPIIIVLAPYCSTARRVFSVSTSVTASSNSRASTICCRTPRLRAGISFRSCPTNS